MSNDLHTHSNLSDDSLSPEEFEVNSEEIVFTDQSTVSDIPESLEDSGKREKKKTGVDLHTHSNHSDGSLSPFQLVKAVAGRCDAIALTDHNTVSGIPEFLKAGRRFGITAVPGIELSTEFEGIEFHLVGLFLPEDRLGDVEAFVSKTRERKRRNNEILAERLIAAGYRVSIDELKNEFQTENINRAHFAKLLYKKGYTGSVKEAFETILNEKNGFYTPAKKPETPDAIALINEIGALSVLAHPFVSTDAETVRRVLTIFKGCGLDGIECRYTEYDKATQTEAEELAEKLDLLKSGGSDFHGDTKPSISLLSGNGDLFVPSEYFFAMKAELDKRKAI